MWRSSDTCVRADPVITVAANTSGGVCGKMISPQSLAVATAAVGLVGKESDIFRFTLKHSLILTAMIAVLVYLQSNVLYFMVPVYAKGAAAAAAAAPAASLVGEGLLWLAGTVAVVVAVVAASIVLGRDPRPTVREEPALDRAA